MAHNKFLQDMAKEGADLAAKNAALPGAKAEAQQKELATVSQFFNGVPPTQLAWTSRLKALKDSGSVSPETLALIPETYSPENAESVRQLGVTAQQAK